MPSISQPIHRWHYHEHVTSYYVRLIALGLKYKHNQLFLYYKLSIRDLMPAYEMRPYCKIVKSTINLVVGPKVSQTLCTLMTIPTTQHKSWKQTFWVAFCSHGFFIFFAIVIVAAVTVVVVVVVVVGISWHAMPSDSASSQNIYLVATCSISSHFISFQSAANPSSAASTHTLCFYWLHLSTQFNYHRP